ncbi:hypothetical protein [Streptomyces sp. NPDC093589]|uniref:hypothetical protein n=1 Tax=Streptomyces sp. NPDC093589 TaxID=3366043 RepID=UPI00382C333B
MRIPKASRALLVSAAAVSILGTTGMASNVAVAADHGSVLKKKTCKVSAYTDRVDRRTDKFGNGAIKCNYKPAYTKIVVTLYKGKKKMAKATCANHKKACYVATKAVKDDMPVQTWRTKVTGAWGSGKHKSVWSKALHG